MCSTLRLKRLRPMCCGHAPLPIMCGLSWAGSLKNVLLVLRSSFSLPLTSWLCSQDMKWSCGSLRGGSSGMHVTSWLWRTSKLVQRQSLIVVVGF